MREPGYYWCKLGGEWIIAKWYGKYWGTINDIAEWEDTLFEEIDENQIKRD